MEHNNVTDALRYVNLLQGGARAAARCWADAARRHLAVRQAAEAVMAHASVSGLLYLQAAEAVMAHASVSGLLYL
ncbi:unnamed protein product [Plutella xylostella]|uniref:MICOS complex subunit MIC60 n=1 Tax=Plutella xylostella TaxID=51655 RepID=A0A8S4GBZ3_PLUXY|nr:unnamed protein product [Plutella xylostella]